MVSGLSARYYVPEASPVKEDSNLEPLEAHRTFFAELMTAIVGVPHSRLTTAFASTPRERYLGPGPWKVFAGRGYTQTPTADPSLLYQDIVVALEEDRGINNGQPSLHALCLSALKVKEGERGRMKEGESDREREKDREKERERARMRE